MELDELKNSVKELNNEVSTLKYQTEELKKEYLLYMLKCQAYSHAIEQLALCGKISTEAQKLIFDMVNGEEDFIRERLTK